jgi:VWFA-related protein
MARQHGRKAIVVMSDVEDRGSKVSLNTAINAAQKADTLVYSILFADDEQPNFSGMGGRRGGRMPPPPQRQSGADGDGKKVLERLARETGGSFYTVSHKLPLSAIFERMQEELRYQYSLGYSPDKPAKSGEFRKIHLATRDKTLVVQSRDGYFGVN